MKWIESLRNNAYPGRGIVIGRSPDHQKAVIVYFIMGRSAGSRNRIFVETADGIRTESFDPSKLPDPSLYVYHPVRKFEEATIVTNGDQTDTICAFLSEGKTFEDALRSRTYEPDPPIYTPRISGIVYRDGTYKLSILKGAQGNPPPVLRFFYEYLEPVSGKGHLIHTYRCDGDPVPPFAGEPYEVEIPDDPDECFTRMWSSLNNENKVALYVRYIDLQTGNVETRMINQNEREVH